VHQTRVNTRENDTRPGRTRTSDLFRVKEKLTNVSNNFESTDGNRSRWKYMDSRVVVYPVVYHE